MTGRHRFALLLACIGACGVTVLATEDALRFIWGGLLPGISPTVITIISAALLVVGGALSWGKNTLNLLICATLLLQLGGRTSVTVEQQGAYWSVEAAHTVAPIAAFTVAAFCFKALRTSASRGLAAACAVFSALWVVSSWVPLPLETLVATRALTVITLTVILLRPFWAAIATKTNQIWDSAAIR